MVSVIFNYLSYENQKRSLDMSVMPFVYLGVPGGGSSGDLYLFNQGKGPAVNVKVELYELGSTHPITAPAGTLAPGESVSLVRPLNLVLGEAMGVTKVFLDPDRMGLILIMMQAGDITSERKCELRARVEATDIFGKRYCTIQRFDFPQVVLEP